MDIVLIVTLVVLWLYLKIRLAKQRKDILTSISEHFGTIAHTIKASSEKTDWVASHFLQDMPRVTPIARSARSLENRLIKVDEYVVYTKRRISRYLDLRTLENITFYHALQLLTQEGEISQKDFMAFFQIKDEEKLLSPVDVQSEELLIERPDKIIAD